MCIQYLHGGVTVEGVGGGGGDLGEGFNVGWDKCGPESSRAFVWKVDNITHWIDLYPVDNRIGFPNTYPLDSDLSSR